MALRSAPQPSRALFALLGALALSAPAARAADSAAQARELFQKGSAALAAGKSQEAIDAFEAAYKAGNSPSLLFFLGEAYRQAGNSAKAVEEYQLYLEKMPNPPKKAEAEQHLAELKKAPAAKRKVALGELDLGGAPSAAPKKKVEMGALDLAAPAAPAAAEKPAAEGAAAGRSAAAEKAAEKNDKRARPAKAEKPPEKPAAPPSEKDQSKSFLAMLAASESAPQPKPAAPSAPDTTAAPAAATKAEVPVKTEPPAAKTEAKEEPMGEAKNEAAPAPAKDEPPPAPVKAAETTAAVEEKPGAAQVAADGRAAVPLVVENGAPAPAPPQAPPAKAQAGALIDIPSAVTTQRPPRRPVPPPVVREPVEIPQVTAATPPGSSVFAEAPSEESATSGPAPTEADRELAKAAPPPPSGPVTIAPRAQHLEAPAVVQRTPHWEGGGMRNAGLIVGTVGVAALTAGVLFGVAASQEANKLTAAAQDGERYDPSVESRGQRDEKLEITMIAVGGAALVGGAAMFFLGPLPHQVYTERAPEPSAPAGPARRLALESLGVTPLPDGAAAQASLRF